MAQYQVGVVVGSIRKDSFNLKLAEALTKLASPDFSFNFIKINELPLYNQDDDSNPAPTVKKFKSEILSSTGILIVTPEYNRGIPGVLKNALDHGSRPYGSNAWAGKPTGVIGASPGKIGTALAQHQLRCVLAYLDAPTMGQPEAYVTADDTLFNPDGTFGSKQRDFMQKWINSYSAWVKSHAQ